MHNFRAHRLRFVAKVRTTIELNEHQGSAIRGALYHAMLNRFCNNRQAEACAVCPLVTTCPVAMLLSTLKPGAPGGRDVPRPYTIQPPITDLGHPVEDGRGRLFFHHRPGERFEFGLTLYAQALQLFPYIVLTVQEFEREGIGRKMQRGDGHWRRGVVKIQEVWAENPLTGERQPVLTGGDNTVQVPDVPITHGQVMENAECGMMNDECRVRFLTPTRLVANGRLIKPHDFHFKPLLQRLLDRLEALSRDFSSTQLDVDFSSLVAASEAVRVVDNTLRWEELRSYSTRRRADTPTSGLLGAVTLTAEDWSPFLPYLIWGQFTHVGKDATKGNGEYRMEDRG